MFSKIPAIYSDNCTKAMKNYLIFKLEASISTTNKLTTTSGDSNLFEYTSRRLNFILFTSDQFTPYWPSVLEIGQLISRDMISRIQIWKSLVSLELIFSITWKFDVISPEIWHPGPNGLIRITNMKILTPWMFIFFNFVLWIQIFEKSLQWN